MVPLRLKFVPPVGFNTVSLGLDNGTSNPARWTDETSSGSWRRGRRSWWSSVGRTRGNPNVSRAKVEPEASFFRQRSNDVALFLFFFSFADLTFLPRPWLQCTHSTIFVSWSHMPHPRYSNLLLYVGVNIREADKIVVKRLRVHEGCRESCVRNLVTNTGRSQKLLQ